MLGLTLWRPWDHAILYGGKPLENRPWKPWARIIGKRIALHAGLKYDTEGAEWMRREGLYEPPAEPLCPKGCIVGTFRVRGWVNELGFDNNGVSTDHDESPWFFGPFGWLLEDVTALESPLPCRGAQSLWQVPAEVWSPTPTSPPTPSPQMKLFE
jgi:hypothetical protein